MDEELALQYKIQTDLTQEKKVIEQNLQLHAKETSEFKEYTDKYHKTIENLLSCEERLLKLKNEIEIKEKIFQTEAVEWATIGSDFQSMQKDEKSVLKFEEFVCEENPLYGVEESAPSLPPAIDRTKKPKEYRPPVQGETYKVDAPVSAEQTLSEKKFDFRAFLEAKQEAVFKKWAEPLSEEKPLRQGAIPKKVSEPSVIKNPTPPIVERSLKPQQSRLEASTLFLSINNDTKDEEKSKEKVYTKERVAIRR